MAVVNLVEYNVIVNDDDNQLNLSDTILDKYSEDHLRGTSVFMVECWYTNLDVTLEDELVFDNGDIKFELQVKCCTHWNNDIINSICETNDRFGVLPQELKLVCLFESNIGRFHE